VEKLRPNVSELVRRPGARYPLRASLETLFMQVPSRGQFRG